MPSQEEIKLKMALDAASLDAGMNQMMQKQKQAADQLLQMWSQHSSQRKMMSEKDSQALEERLLNIEVEGASRRNRARQLMRDREKVQAERHARDMAKIEQGFVPETWQQQATLNKKYGGKYSGSTAHGQMLGGQFASDLTSGGDVLESAEQYGTFTLGALMGGHLQKTMKKMMHKITKGSLKGIGWTLGPLFAGYEGWKVGSEINEKYVDPWMWGWQKDQGVNPAEKSVGGFGGQMTDRIQAALNGGRISFQEAARLRNASFGDLLDFAKGEPGYQTRQLLRAQSTEDLKANFASRDALGSIIKQLQARVDAHNFETVSISDIAGRDWSRERAAMYGEGGQFDLGAGKGRLAAVAREYETARYAQMCNRMNGNKDAAKAAQERMNKAEGILSDYGATTQKMDINAMRRGIERMTNQLNDLGVRIVAVDEQN